MHRGTRAFATALVSLVRLVCALLFAATAFQDVTVWMPVSLYGSAILSDAIDGTIARRFDAVTYFGKIVDLVSDKSLTIVSLLYAAARGVQIVPLALIAIREVIMLGMRLIMVDGSQLLPTSRVFGGVMALCVWGNTLFLLVTRSDGNPAWVGRMYWACALAFSVNLVHRLYRSRHRIKESLKQVG